MRNCAGCAHYLPPEAPAMPEIGAQPMPGQCRRYPPMPLPMIATNNMRQQMQVVQSFFPPIMGDAVCGEWAIKASTH